MLGKVIWSTKLFGREKYFLITYLIFGQHVLTKSYGPINNIMTVAFWIQDSLAFLFEITFFTFFSYNPFLFKLFYIIYHCQSDNDTYRKKTFNSSMALDIDLEIIWPNEYKSDHHIWIVQLTPWSKETIFMVIYLILCVVRIVNVMTKKNVKQLLFCFGALENDLLLEKYQTQKLPPLSPKSRTESSGKHSESYK